ncbi:DNA polymerase III subunit delta' [Enterococcus asini]|uniref:DNA polymerase III subunit delta' n=1 Tax=Enterococcus asini TaxID=57732 RepID=UPI001E5A5092|nr:DNA polymerase III subunit delta' [Enterococcus asini]MCD5028210.1 DNA polymerase III subunit delta' [Enterococcus asini]MDT2784998.1 DNA polymerase III subunit delta' [Enterococcus asini]
MDTFLAQNQPLVYSQIKKSVEHGRLAHAYLFEGDQGVGKHELSLWLAKRLFCTQVVDNEPCNECNNCLRIAAGEHPNLWQIKPDGQSIKVDQIRQLQQEFVRSGFESRLQFFTISHADKMNASAANSLLKFLEEPAGSFVAILETDSPGKILPTIQSRCQILHFAPLNTQALVAKLVEAGIGTESATLLAALTNSYQKAVEISQEEWFNEAKAAVSQWYLYLANNDLMAFVYVQKKLTALAKEKERQQLLLQMLMQHFRQARSKLLNGDVLALKENTRRIELLLEAEQKLGANVSFQNVCEQLVLRMIHQD